MAIHATDLLYDIALPLSCYSFVLSFSLYLPPLALFFPHSWHSLLYPFAPLSLLSWLPVYFFPCVIAGCESILYPARLMATTTESLILRRLIRHDYAHPPPLHVVIGFRGRIPPRTICLTHSNRGYYRTAIFISISKPSLGLVFLARSLARSLASFAPF